MDIAMSDAGFPIRLIELRFRFVQISEKAPQMPSETSAHAAE
jgi:hypothetical protein